MKTLFTYKPGIHKNQKVIFIYFEKDFQLTQEVKSWVGRKYSKTNKCWYVPDVLFYRDKFGISHQKELSNFLATKISPFHQLELRKTKATLEIKGYSPNTIRNYSSELIQFFIYIKPKEATEIKNEDLKNYIWYCITQLKLTENAIHSRVNAMKFY